MAAKPSTARSGSTTSRRGPWRRPDDPGRQETRLRSGMAARIVTRAAPPFPSHRVEGGPRARLFYPQYAEEGALRRNAMRAARVLAIPASALQALIKILLIRWHSSVARLGNHVTR